MAIARPILGLLAIVLLGASILFQFFIILSGYVTSTTPFSNTYFLSADGVNGQTARWTYLSVCAANDDGTNNCSGTMPGGTFPYVSQGIPSSITDDYNKYYYLSRFAWAFWLIALAFSALAFATSLLSLCSRLGAYLTGSSVFVALFFEALAASLITAWTVLGRNAFLANNQNAYLGRYAYGFMWASVACLLLASILFCTGGAVSGSSSSSGKRSYFGRKRSTRSRGSFIDTESGRRVKDEYD